MSKILYGNYIDTLWLTGPNPQPNGILSFFGLTDFSFFVNSMIISIGSLLEKEKRQ